MRFARRRTPIALAVVLLVGLLTPATAPAEKTIALNTGTIELSLAPGGIATEVIRVANDGDEPFKALLYTSDVAYDDGGQPSYVKPTGEPGEFLRSPASWMNLRIPDTAKVIANTPYIELDPGQGLEIEFEMRVPPNATPGDYNAILFFEMFDFVEGDRGATSSVAGRIGARVVLRVEGDIVDDIAIAPYSVRSFVIGDVVPYSFRVLNRGNIDKRYVPSLIVLDGSGSERMRSVVETTAVVYARAQREYFGTLDLENTAFGRFTIRAELAYEREVGGQPGAGIPDTVSEDRTIWVIPLWVLIAAILVIGMPILWLSWRTSTGSSRRKKDAARRARDERRQRLAERRASSLEDEL